eukprot:61680-Pleurochrysis_carterae.AAC.1
MVKEPLQRGAKGSAAALACAEEAALTFLDAAHACCALCVREEGAGRRRGARLSEARPRRDCACDLSLARAPSSLLLVILSLRKLLP